MFIKIKRKKTTAAFLFIFLLLSVYLYRLPERARATEAKTNLASIYSAAKAYREEFGIIQFDFKQIGFAPDGGGRYIFNFVRQCDDQDQSWFENNLRYQNAINDFATAQAMMKLPCKNANSSIQLVALRKEHIEATDTVIFLEEIDGRPKYHEMTLADATKIESNPSEK